MNKNLPQSATDLPSQLSIWSASPLFSCRSVVKSKSLPDREGTVPIRNPLKWLRSTSGSLPLTKQSVSPKMSTHSAQIYIPAPAISANPASLTTKLWQFAQRPIKFWQYSKLKCVNDAKRDKFICNDQFYLLSLSPTHSTLLLWQNSLTHLPIPVSK